ncbi:uncharacterized protein C1orf105 homolog [Saccopteryx leptura]|uniref:uncharacterized protein C1orf105 homolog n=1 Tax=Saccopteryx leptura TaxID=249018 RepID=UPI00339CF9DE
MEKRELKMSTPKFDKIPWLSQASLRNKPLVLSLPKRYPHASAAFLIPSTKDMNLPNLFQVPNDFSKARRNEGGPMLVGSRQLCSACQEMRSAQSRTLVIPDDLKLSFEHFISRRRKSLQPPKAQTAPKRSSDNISAESIPYRLPIRGPRMAVFHGLLSDSYRALRGLPLPSAPRREPAGKTARQ